MSTDGQSVPGHVKILHTSSKPCQKTMTVSFGNFLLVCTYRVYLESFSLTARKARVQVALNISVLQISRDRTDFSLNSLALLLHQTESPRKTSCMKLNEAICFHVRPSPADEQEGRLLYSSRGPIYGQSLHSRCIFLSMQPLKEV